MPRPGSIEEEGLVCAVSCERLCQVKLANGHTLWAYSPRRQAADFRGLRVGDRVRVEMSLFDLSRGRLIAKLERNLD